MKKNFLLAAIACTALIVSCGGSMTPAEKAKDYARRIKEAEGNDAKVIKIHKEANKYANGLSAKEKDEFYDELGKALGY